MNIVKDIKLRPNQFFDQRHPKTSICLHYTAGPTAQGAIDWWNKTPDRVATPYIVDRDGTIYEVFDPGYWAFHLGGKCSSKTNANCLGIEVVNWGNLTKRNDVWISYTGTTVPNEEVHEETFRGYHGYQKFPKVQFDAVCELVLDLCRRFQIEPKIPHEKDRIEVLRNINGFAGGIYSHQNFRREKRDIGPAWDWNAMPGVTPHLGVQSNAR